MSSEEPSTVRVKARPVLSEMPSNIKEMIAENTVINTRFTLRKVSTHFRAAVDFSKLSFEDVEIRSCELYVLLILNGMRIVYIPYGRGVDILRGSLSVTLIGEDFVKKALDDFEIIMKSPKIHVKHLKLSISRDEEIAPRVKNRIREIFHSFSHKLSIGELTVETSSDQNLIVELLRDLKPRILKSLRAGNVEGSCAGIVDTEHWPFLEEAVLGDVGGVPISKFLHLRRFQARDLTMTREVVEEIVQAFLQHPNNHECYKFSTGDGNLFPVWEEAMSDYSPARPIIPIPGTDYQLKIKSGEFHRFMVLFERIGGPVQ